MLLLPIYDTENTTKEKKSGVKVKGVPQFMRNIGVTYRIDILIDGTLQIMCTPLEEPEKTFVPFLSFLQHVNSHVMSMGHTTYQLQACSWHDTSMRVLLSKFPLLDGATNIFRVDCSQVGPLVTSQTICHTLGLFDEWENFASRLAQRYETSVANRKPSVVKVEGKPQPPTQAKPLTQAKPPTQLTQTKPPQQPKSDLPPRHPARSPFAASFQKSRANLNKQTTKM